MDNIKHTVNLFKRLYEDLPPLVPEKVEKDMKKAVEQLENNMHLSREEVEDTIVEFGKKTWPYRKAFHEFLDVYEGKMGEKIFLTKMSKQFKQKYKEFKEEGCDFRDLFQGRHIDFFTLQERTKLHQALSETRKDVKKHVRQKVVSSEKNSYKESIKEFEGVLEEIENHLQTLKELADNEQEHPEIVTEIKTQIKDFEHSLGGLGGEVKHEEISNAKEHFKGRKEIKQEFSD